MRTKKLITLMVVVLATTITGFSQTQDTVWLITYKRVTVIPQSCPEGNMGCTVYHFKEDVSDEMIKIFYEEADADAWIKENENDWMYKAIEIKKEKLTKDKVKF